MSPGLARVIFRLWARRRPWLVFGGAAARLYGSRRPITDVDILVPPGDLPELARAFGAAVEVRLNERGRVQRVELGGVELCGEAVNRIGGKDYRFALDPPMVARRRLRRLGALPVWVAPPEDCLLMKAILQRGPERGKHDLADARDLAARRLDEAYLEMRITALGAAERVRPVLEELGRWPLS